MKKAVFTWFIAFVLLTIPFDVVAQKARLVPQRKTLAEIPWSQSVSNRPGSGMQPGLDSVFVAGDGNQKELYSLVFKVRANTAIQPHSHPDDRSCFVLAGVWYFGYGTVRDETKLQALPTGSNYTEPAGAVHFAGTKAQEAIVECTGVGPTGTSFVKSGDDPRNEK
jgi:quercetin dioxygenase-like cupin family protein